jgi:hypothetical protein
MQMGYFPYRDLDNRRTAKLVDKHSPLKAAVVNIAFLLAACFFAAKQLQAWLTVESDRCRRISEQP